MRIKEMYDVRLNGMTVALTTSFEEAKAIYEAKKEANPLGYYEVFKLK